MSNYIMDLRQIVGHRPLLQVGASVIVEDCHERILLQKRSDNHCWGYAGGSVELDEVVEDAAKRELKEETGLIAHHLELFGIFSGEQTHYIYPNGDEVSNVDIVYICKDYSGTLKCQESEVEDLRFFDVNEIPENISQPLRIPIQKWVEEKLKTEDKNVLLKHIHEIHITELGKERISKNLQITYDVVEYCKDKILNESCYVYRKGKNWYCEIDHIVITINAHSYTIITAHVKK